VQLARLRWRCRRGMRELDVLLSRYLETAYLHADTGHRRAFESLLELPDPVILDYVLGRAFPGDSQHRQIIDCLTTGVIAMGTCTDRPRSDRVDGELSSR
jgi:antitoxin CptB